MSSYERDDYDQPERSSTARDRVSLPAIFLIIVGVFNILGSLYYVFNGGVLLFADPHTLQQQIEINPILKGQNVGVDQLRGYGWFYIGFGVFAILMAFLTILGGVLMRSLRAYVLAMIASVVAAIPCISPMSCPCLGIGAGIGIWSLVVLLSPQVQAAFRGDAAE